MLRKPPGLFLWPSRSVGWKSRACGQAGTVSLCHNGDLRPWLGLLDTS